MTRVLVPRARLPRWVDNFTVRHGETGLRVVDGALRGDGGGRFLVHRPSPVRAVVRRPGRGRAFLADAGPPPAWGVLLVRKGGFAVARLAGERLVESKVGQRHVQGRTKAGGQSQQRFARRRDNQARQAYDAAADHAARILAGLDGPLVTGGDHSAVDAVLADPRLTGLVVGPWLAVPDPRRAILEAAIRDAQAVADRGRERRLS